jgi:glycosyltransferase involved in cell wall biosynthesis
MNSNSQPLVSIVTPLYNAEEYISECMQSVVSQTYQNWEYVIVNNCSTDKSLEIAEKFAQAHSKIKIHNNSKFLSLFQNWNHALNQISDKSKYCKVVHADDWLFPECITKMVELAELNPSVGIVGSYRLDENRVNLAGLPYKRTIFSGHEICRETLLDRLYLFGSPTSILIRSDYIRKFENFYDESNIHSDKEICFEILENSDFGFVHQILTFTRRHNESVTSATNALNTHKMGRLRAFIKYGPVFLGKEEYEKHKKRIVNNYHRFLSKSILGLKGDEFWLYQRNELAKLGIRINLTKVAKYLILELLNPKESIDRIRFAKRKKQKYKNDQRS